MDVRVLFLVCTMFACSTPARAEVAEQQVWSEPLEGLFSVTYPSNWTVHTTHWEDVILRVRAPPPERAGCEINRVTYDYRVAQVDQEHVNAVMAAWDQDHALRLAFVHPWMTPRVEDFRTDMVGPVRVASFRFSVAEVGSVYSRHFLLARHPLLLYNISCTIAVSSDTAAAESILHSLSFSLEAAL